MLCLVFSLDAEHYLLNVAQIHLLLPLIRLKTIAGAPPWVAGLFEYHQQMVPVIDLAQATIGRPSEQLSSTRLALVDYVSEQHETRLLGVILENAVDTLRCNENDFDSSGLDIRDTPFLGSVLRHENRLLQLLTPNLMIPGHLQAMLFPSESDG
jgi:chemotaxis-related protein WspB